MSDGKNTAAAAAALNLAADLADDGALSAQSTAIVANALLTAAGGGHTPAQLTLAISLAEAAIEAHKAITTATTPAEVEAAWARMAQRAAGAGQAWDDAGNEPGAKRSQG